MWKDVTGYSRSGDREPKSWSVAIDGLRLAITYNHIDYPGQWVMSCEPWFNKHVIGDAALISVGAAKSLALKNIRAKLDDAHLAVSQLLGG